MRDEVGGEGGVCDGLRRGGEGGRRRGSRKEREKWRGDVLEAGVRVEELRREVRERVSEKKGEEENRAHLDEKGSHVSSVEFDFIQWCICPAHDRLAKRLPRRSKLTLKL